MSRIPFNKKKEDAGVPFEMGGKLPDFFTVVPIQKSIDKVEKEPDMVSGISAPDISPPDFSPHFQPDTVPYISFDTPSLVMPGTESMKVYTPDGMYMPEHEISVPVAQSPSVSPSLYDYKKDIISRLQLVIQSFVATGRLKTRIVSFPKLTAPLQATSSAPQSLQSSQVISPQTEPSQSVQPVPEATTSTVHVAQPAESMKHISGHIQKIYSVIESLSSVVSSMDARLDEVSATALPEAQLPDIENLVTNLLSEKLSSMDASTINVAGEVFALKESVWSLKSTMESNASKLVEVLNAQSIITDIQTDILAKVDELGSRTDVNMEDIADTSAQVKAASEALESLAATVSVLLDDVSSTLSTTSEMEGIIRRLQVDKASVEELSGFIESVHQQIQELETGISDVQEESKGVENMGNIDTLVHTPLVKLTQIKNEQPFVKLCMEWLEFLLELVGNNNMPEILDYYVGIGWISDDARLELMLMAQGMDNYTEKGDWKLHPDDHLKSLWFIEHLCGIKLDRFAMQQIDRDISKMKEGLETMYNL